VKQGRLFNGDYQKKTADIDRPAAGEKHIRAVNIAAKNIYGGLI